MSEALTLPGIKAGTWQVRHRADRAALALADRHYSRKTPGCGRLGGPNRILVLITPCERAAWITEHAIHPPDGIDAYRCTLFRNEGAGLSSDLITAAMALTERLWGSWPGGWVTWVDTAKVNSPNPGYCFLRAGWWRDRSYQPGRRRASLIRLRAHPASSSPSTGRERE